MNKTFTKRGFTLIELLVVIAIIALLSSIVLANLANTRAKAQNSKTIQETKQYLNAFTMYADDNNSNVPPIPNGFTHLCLGRSETAPCQMDLYDPTYTSGSDAFNALMSEYISPSDQGSDILYFCGLPGQGGEDPDHPGYTFCGGSPVIIFHLKGDVGCPALFSKTYLSPWGLDMTECQLPLSTYING